MIRKQESDWLSTWKRKGIYVRKVGLSPSLLVWLRLLPKYEYNNQEYHIIYSSIFFIGLGIQFINVFHG